MTLSINFYQDDLPDNLELKGNLAIDTETMGLNIKRDKLCLIQMSDEAGNISLVNFKNGDYSAPNLKKLLLDNSRVKIFHYARFDIASIGHYLNIAMNNIFCTKIASKLVRTYTDFHGLKELCRELLNIQISKEQQSSDWGSPTLTPKQKEYAAKDVIYLHQLRDILIDMLTREKRLDLATECMQFLNTRVQLDLRGWSEIDIFAH
jgi:ribonuclease D